MTNTLDELVEQYLELYKSGNAPDIRDYANAHPEHGAELAELLKLALEMENLHVATSQGGLFPAIPELPGTDYRLTRRLGQGGMGTVYEAEQISLNRKVAVKLLAPSLLLDEEQRRQFETEARVIAMLHHPNIVKILSAECNPSRCFYAMELVEGKGADRYEKLSLREVARIGLATAKALAYAHRCGVLHRDIKPSNLLMDATGEVRVSDFGLACLLREQEKDGGQTDVQSGTLRYMSPEMVSQGVNTPTNDQYAFGATLYELATGCPMIKASTAKAMRERICAEPAPRLKSSEPDLDAIINKCLRFHPEERYASMDDVAEDLQRFLNHEPVNAAPSSMLRRVRLWGRRKPTAAALSLVAVLCMVAFILSLVVGYLRTAAALEQAELNAAVADKTLSQVFARIAEQPPSLKNTQLLSTLLPYYRMIARERKLPNDDMCKACAIIGESAMRAGSYREAEEAYRYMMEFRKDAFPINQLAATLRKQGKTAEADQLSGQVAERFSNSPNEQDRYEAVRALLALSSTP